MWIGDKSALPLPQSIEAEHILDGSFLFEVNRMNTNAVLAYGVREACDACGIGRTRLYALISEGKIEARQCGGRTLIPAESLRAFVNSLPAAPIRRKAIEVA